MTEKVPLIEMVFRWVDIYTFLHYPDEIAADVYTLISKNSNIKGYPHVLAATAVYITCQKRGILFDFPLIESIAKAHRRKRNEKAGLNLTRIRSCVKKWKL